MPSSRPRRSLATDAVVTIGLRLGLAVLIVATDLLLARLLGPAAKGRFALVLLYSQLAALVVGLGMDQALAVVSGRGVEPARRGMANAIIWTAVVGGFSVVLSGWLYGLGSPGRPNGPLTVLIPNLSASQFAYAAIAIPGELFFLLGLNVLLGRRLVADYGLVRVLRRALLLILIVAMALIASVNLDLVLVLNIVALIAAAIAIAISAARAGVLGVRPSGSLLAEQLRFGMRALPGSLAERLQFRSDAFLVNAILGVRMTGIYSVTSGLAETLWYIPNALGVVMLSRAVDRTEDSGRIAAVLTRTTLLLSFLLAIPAFLLGPFVVDVLYGSEFSEAGVALRYILPGVVAYSVVAVLSRYIVGKGRPGLGTAILVVGLAANIASNLILIAPLGIVGAAVSSSISYVLTAALTVLAFQRLSGVGLGETLVVRASDIRAITRRLGELRSRRKAGAMGEDEATSPVDEYALSEHEPGDEV
jgi:O-antigen/teichoic acid export membrane protein